MTRRRFRSLFSRNYYEETIWAEIFLLAKETKTSATKWQILVPKLIPVNVRQIGERSKNVVVSRISAGNGKNSKVIDAVIYSPGIDIFRGSDCFVYWCDPQKGLTWGLNFINSGDAASFLNIVQGGKGITKYSPHSISKGSSLEKIEIEKRNNRNCTSDPSTPDIHNPNRWRSQPPDYLNCINSTDKTKQQNLSSLEINHQQVKKLNDDNNSCETAPPGNNYANYVNGSDDHFIKNTVNYTNHSWNSLPNTPTVKRRSIYGIGEEIGQFRVQLAENISTFCPNKDNNCQNKSNLRTLIVNNNSTSSDDLGQRLAKCDCDKDLDDPNNKNFVSVKAKLSGIKTNTDIFNHKPFSSNKATQNRKYSCQGYNSDGEIWIKRQTPNSDHNNNSNFKSEPSNDDWMEFENDLFDPLAMSRIVNEGIMQMSLDSNLLKRMIEPLSSVSEHEHDGVITGASPLFSASDARKIQNINAVPICRPNVPSTSSLSPPNRIKKTGPIIMKQWLNCENGRLMVLAEETWKRYWCCVRGTTAHFYEVIKPNLCSDNSAKSTGIDQYCLKPDAKYIVQLQNCLCLPIFDYPKRENVFCFTTSLGQSFLIQVSSKVEVRNWVHILNSTCATAFCRTCNRHGTIQTLENEISLLMDKIQSLTKKIKTERITNSAANEYHASDLLDEFEAANMDIFKFKAYLTALRGQQGDYDPTNVLNCATRTSRSILNNHGVFNCSSLFALVAQKNRTKVKLLSRQPESESPKNDASKFETASNLIQVKLPRNQVSLVRLEDLKSAPDLHVRLCTLCRLEPCDHFVVFRSKYDDQLEIDIGATMPINGQTLETIVIMITEYNIEICEKLTYHLHMTKSLNQQKRVFGFTVKTDKINESYGVKVTVTHLSEGCSASKSGIIKGDELLFINGQNTEKMASSDVEHTLQNNFELCLIVKTKQLSIPSAAIEQMKLDNMKNKSHWQCPLGKTKNQEPNGIDSDLWFNEARCPSAIFRTNSRKLSADAIKRDLLRQKRLSLPNMDKSVRKCNNVQAPDESMHNSMHESYQKLSTPDNEWYTAGLVREQIDDKKVTWNDQNEPINNCVRSSSSVKLSPVEKVEKVVIELVETEKAYVKDLDDLLNFYLFPLSKESSICFNDLDKLVDSCKAILKFHRLFLEEINDTIFWAPQNDCSPIPSEGCNLSQLKNSLLHLGGLFLTAAVDFKVYSTFCTNYFRIQKMLREENNESLRAFLTSRNFKRQHSFTLESYLIKPVQRVLRYPLFLSQIKALTEQGRPEHVQISDALDKMEKVAEYINEMQRVYEEYGDLFSKIQYANLEICDLLMFGEVEWLNPGEENGKKRTFACQDCLLFIFKSGVLLVQQQVEKRRGKSTNDKVQSYRFIPINQLEVNGSDVGSTEERHIWVLIHIDFQNRSEKIYHFSNRNLEMKQEFLKSIRKACFYDTRAKSSKYNDDNNRALNFTSKDANDTLNTDNYDNFVVIRPINKENNCDSNVFDLNPCRPNCYCSKHTGSCSVDNRPSSYSSQSDPGYGSSNGDNHVPLQKR